jgi:hypothetical protein
MHETGYDKSKRRLCYKNGELTKDVEIGPSRLLPVAYDGIPFVEWADTFYEKYPILKRQGDPS